MFYVKYVRKFMRAWPGKKYLGEYRFLPIFFFGGAVIEFSMIHWHAGEVNFYKVYKKKRVQEIADATERQALLADSGLTFQIKIHH